MAGLACGLARVANLDVICPVLLGPFASSSFAATGTADVTNAAFLIAALSPLLMLKVLSFFL